MSRDDQFIVRHSSTPAVGESVPERAVINRMGYQVVVDFVTQQVLSGNAYHIQLGALSTAVAGTAALTALIGVGIVTNPAGQTLVPLAAEMHIATYAAVANYLSMIELDMAKNRYTSGGTQLTPRNLRGDSPHSYNGSGGGAFNNTGTLVIAAASAAPHSVELSRRAHSEDNIATSTGADSPFIWSIRSAPGAAIVGVGSVVLHHGPVDAIYGLFQFAQLDSGLVV